MSKSSDIEPVADTTNTDSPNEPNKPPQKDRIDPNTLPTRLSSLNRQKNRPDSHPSSTNNGISIFTAKGEPDDDDKPPTPPPKKEKARMAGQQTIIRSTAPTPSAEKRSKGKGLFGFSTFIAALVSCCSPSSTNEDAKRRKPTQIKATESIEMDSVKQDD